MIKPTKNNSSHSQPIPATANRTTGGSMTPNMLRQLWSLIEKTQVSMLLKSDDATLVQSILKQITQERLLEHEEVNILNDYLYSKLSLIRDLAQEKCLDPN